MRVLVTGAGGQVGSDVVAVCESAGDDVIAATHATLDVGNRDQVLGALTTLRPDAVIHTACWTAVDLCESNPAKAFRVNAFGTRNVAEGARLAGAHLVSISTDYVFDGTLDRSYNEWDATNPLSVYGASKLAGDLDALAQCPGAAVVRTASVQGFHGSNIVKTVLKLGADRERPLAFVGDQTSCPTFAADLAPLLRRLAVGRFPGVIHATNAGSATWFEFAKAILDRSGLGSGRLSAVDAATLDRPAPRPANSVLENAVLGHLGLDLLPPWEDALDRLLKELGSA